MESFPWKEMGIFLSYALMGLLGVVVKTLWDAMQELRTDLAKLREELARNYMPRVEIREVVDDVIDEIRTVVKELKEHELREQQWHKEALAQVGESMWRNNYQSPRPRGED